MTYEEKLTQTQNNMTQNEKNPLTEKEIAGKERIDTAALAQKALEDQRNIDTLAVSEEKRVPHETAQVRSGIEKMKNEKTEQEKKKEFVTAAINSMVEDLRKQAGFDDGEKVGDFVKRMSAKHEGFIGSFRKFADATKMEMAQKISDLESKKDNATGDENIDLIKTQATFCSKNVDREIEVAYQTNYPGGNYKDYKNKIEEDADAQTETSFGSNKWAA